jgi:hypothetical protein
MGDQHCALLTGEEQDYKREIGAACIPAHISPMDLVGGVGRSLQIKNKCWQPSLLASQASQGIFASDGQAKRFGRLKQWRWRVGYMGAELKMKTLLLPCVPLST